MADEVEGHIQKANIAKPDYDQSRTVSYEVLYRNVIGIKQDKKLQISFQKLQVTITNPSNAKIVQQIPASCIRMAVPSQNVDSQVTILVQGLDRESFKVWTLEEEKQKVNLIIRDINQLVQLYKDVVEEQRVNELQQ